MSALTKKFRVLRRSRRGVRLCLRGRGRGRFIVSARRGRIDLVVTTVKGHRPRNLARRSKLKGGRVRGATRIRPRLFAGRKTPRGRVVYGVRRGRLRFMAVARPAQVAKPRRLTLRLKRFGLWRL